MSNSPYVDGTGSLRQRSLASGDGTIGNPDVADFAPKYINDTPIDGVTMPTGGEGLFGWLTAIQKSITDIFSRPEISYISGTINTLGDNTIVATPGAGLSFYITHLILQNDSASPTVISLKGSSNIIRYRAQSQGDAVNMVFPERREIKLSANTAIIINLNAANATGYSIGYYAAP